MFDERCEMYALLVLRVLVDGNRFSSGKRVPLHAFWIGMTRRTESGDIGGENRSSHIVHATNAVCVMARRADGHIVVALRQTHAVDAARILSCLIDTLLGCVFAHEVRVAVTPRAGRDDLHPGR